MAGNSEEKTEKPSPQKKRKAREEGNIAKSPELVTWGGLLVATYLVPILFSQSTQHLDDLIRSMGPAVAHPTEGVALQFLGDATKTTISIMAPLLGGMMVWGILANLAQTRGSVSLKRLKWKPDRINPAKGLKRLLSPQSAWQLAKQVSKLVVLFLVAWGPLNSMVKRLSGAQSPPFLQMASMVGGTGLQIARNVALSGLLLGAMDYGYNFRKVSKSLKMTKQEVKEESKSSEGNPMLKGAIRQKQREMSRNRMLATVADASVVIVNPTHVAVALKYSPGTLAPVLVAKGRGVIAEKIKEQARSNSVPIVRDVALAWTLHDTCVVDRPIPTELFAAVARILAFVMSVARRSTIGAELTVPGRGPQLPDVVGRKRVKGPRAA